MSATQTLTTTTTTVDAKPKAVRKPTLSAKYSKFLVANYSLIQLLKAKGLLTDESVETAYSEIKLFDSIETQGEFYDAYLKNASASAKVMRKFVTQRNKPPKAPRTKKPRKTKSEEEAAATTSVVAAPVNAEVKDKKPRKPRAKKEIKISDDASNDVVAELVSAANSSIATPEASTDTTTVTAAPKKARKPRAKKEEKKVTEVVPPPLELQEEEDEEEIHTQEKTIGDATYLIDGETNLYSCDSHEQVGTFDGKAAQLTAYILTFYTL